MIKLALSCLLLLVSSIAFADADLAISKTVSNPTPNVGDTVTFTVTLTNNGPNTANTITASDSLPAGLTFVSATASQGSYNSGTGVWTVGTLANGASATLSIQATVISPSSSTNTATITNSDQPDPVPGNNTSSATVTPQSADLAMAKTVSNATPNVGDTVTFTVTLSNAGPNAATNVTAIDLLPAGLTFVSATPSQGSYNSGTGLWTVGTLANGASATLTIQATVISPSSSTNTATITHSDQFDPNTGNNTASATITPQSADLAITKAVSNATPNVGDTVTFTVNLSNTGPDAATNVTATDLLPAGLTFVSATPSQGTYSSGTGLWTVGTLANGASATLTIQATVITPTAITNTATITHSDQFDPNPGNNTASVTVTPQPADLAITKAVNNPTPNLGDTVTFTVTLTNGGPSNATNVTATDLLPAGLTFVSATPSQGTYSSGTGLWTVGTLANGASATLSIQATVTAPGSITNTATITHSDQFDPNPNNNTASVTILAQPADLAIAKTVNNSTPNVGDTVTFTVTLSNAGPNTATNVTATDLLPAGLTFVSATPSQGTYNSGTGVWTVGTVANGASTTLTIQATVTSPGSITNTATISHSDQPDPNPSNNTASVTINAQSADLAITKTVNNATPNVGDNVTFTVTLNNAGPSNATNVTATDLLPAGLTFVSATPSQGSYNSGTGLWTVGTLANGASATLNIVATVTSTTAITNTATITHSDQPDPNPSNNTTSVTINPITTSSITLTKSASITHFLMPNTPITYSYLIKNSGNVILTNVTLTDTHPGLSAIICPKTTLQPGEAETCSATYSTTLADLKRGQITNTATVTALAPDWSIVQAQSSATVLFDETFIRKKTLEAIKNFLSTRAQLVLSDGPDRRRIMNRLSVRTQCSNKPQGNFHPNNDQIAFDASLSLDELCIPSNQWNVWTEVHGTHYEQNKREMNRQGEFGIGYLGIDYLFNSSVVIGILGEGDLIKQTGSLSSGINNANGQGWMIGPYLSTHLEPNIYFHTRAAWGGSSNNINVFNLYNDSFNTFRSFYNAELVGDWYHKQWRISPTAGISYYSELQKKFINYVNVAIPEQQMNLGEINVGPEFAYLYKTINNKQITFRLSLQGIYNFAYNNDNDFVDEFTPINPFSGRAKLGAEFRSPSGFSITPMFEYNGIGTDIFNSIGGQIQVSVPWH